MLVSPVKPAVLFGGDFNTYILWLITPEGRVQNLGELILNGDKSSLKARTPLSNFGLFVTAEPHLLVDFPSRMVVFSMEKPKDHRVTDFRTAQLRYEGVKGLYDFTRETLAGAPEIGRDNIAFDVAEARTAVRLAEHSGAGQFAAVELQAARQALQRAEEAAAAEKKVDNRISLSREAVRLAVRAQTLAQERLFQARQAFEQARQSARAVEQRYRELSLEQQRRDQMVLEAERSLREAEQSQQSLRNQRPRTEADAATTQQQVDQARAQADQARQEAEQARQRAQQAEQEAQRARELAGRRQDALQSEQQAHRQAEQRLNQLQAEKARTHEQLRDALGRIAETRETAQGLIVNLPDILFDFDSATLKPQAREVLAEIAQTLSSGPERCRLRIEGYTDNVGQPD